MGTDIHMKLMHKDGTLMCDDLYGGRNSEWFDCLSGRGGLREYDYLEDKITYGLPENCPDKEDELAKNSYFGFRTILAKDYLDWYLEYKPYLHAGWVHKIDAWSCETKGISPNDIYPTLPEDAIVEDFEFITYTDKYDPNSVVSHRIWTTLNGKDPVDYYIYYYFDC